MNQQLTHYIVAQATEYTVGKYKSLLDIDKYVHLLSQLVTVKG
jgi:hypothetical protein